MYVQKFSRHRILWKAIVFEKTWSDEMMANVVAEIDSKKFLTRSHAKRWANAQITKDLFQKKKLQILQ